jgi:hypothetical protein
MEYSRQAQLCYGSDDDLEDDAQSATTYHEVEVIEVNDDEYWDVYFDAED